jgi:hypothetical protein
MGKFLAAICGLIAAAVWFLLFVILGSALGTAFIAAGCVFAAGALAAVMVSVGSARSILDAPLTSAGVLLGIAAFAVLEVVLSVSTWIGVVSGLGVMGLYGMANAFVGSHTGPAANLSAEPPESSSAAGFPWVHNGHNHVTREPVGAR